MPSFATPSPASTTSCVSFESVAHTNHLETNHNDESYEMKPVEDTASSANEQADLKLVDAFTDSMTAKVKEALLDGHFSVKETAGLTLAVCSGTQALFPTLRGEGKKEIAITVIHTAIRTLMSLGLLSPEFEVALSVIPGMIDTVIYISGGMEMLWEKIVPQFLAWLRRVVWGENPNDIDQQHVELVVATLDVTNLSGHQSFASTQ